MLAVHHLVMKTLEQSEGVVAGGVSAEEGGAGVGVLRDLAWPCPALPHPISLPRVRSLTHLSLR